jgi:hypothetical protein
MERKKIVVFLEIHLDRIIMYNYLFEPAGISSLGLAIDFPGAIFIWPFAKTICVAFPYYIHIQHFLC